MSIEEKRIRILLKIFPEEYNKEGILELIRKAKREKEEVGIVGVLMRMLVALTPEQEKAFEASYIKSLTPEKIPRRNN